MPISIVPYTDAHISEVHAFNQRLARGGVPEQEFPETPDPGWLPDMHLYVAVEDEKVRGGYILRPQQFSVAGEIIDAAHYRLPLSEGVIERAYANLGLRLVRDALARQPRLYALGMGGWDRPLPKMLKALKWRMGEVPFHFKIVNPTRFLRNIRAVRTTTLRRFVLDAAALTGAGWLGMKVAGLARRLPATPCDLANSFAVWADEVWQRSYGDYALIARRDAAMLDALYPPADPRFIRMRAAGGWALLLDTQMKDHKQFGDMRVGTIVDCLAPLDAAPAVMRAAAALLESHGVDIIVSNQMHGAWSRALLDAGFRRGPSNYLLALAPAFAATVGGAADHDFHFNRGDGDGPIHL
jgi:hypothetical protein